ncbi:MAG: T9SS type A sorting domain-containing protein [bacterium]|nr:T9SS type A sorting domain-containing protein [bacterium]
MRNLLSSVMLLAGLEIAFGQPNEIVITYNDCDHPLTTLCGGGVAIPDYSVEVELMWDQNNNGPDSTDQPARQSENGPPFTIPMNGGDLLGCEGTFISESTFTPWPSPPNPPRYWLRIYIADGPTTWRTGSFTVTEWYFELLLQHSHWFCNESPVACTPPPQVPGFIVREDGCNEYSIEWQPYPAWTDVDSLFLRRGENGQLIARLPRIATTYSDTTLPPGRAEFVIFARRVCTAAQDTTLSPIAVSDGARFVRPSRVTSVAATDGMPTSVTITWSPVANATSYRVYRDSDWIGTSGALQYTDETVSPGVIHWYSVTAYNSNNPDNCAEGEHSTLESGHMAATAVPHERPGIPDEVTLSQNYPNPFNAETTIEFSVPRMMPVRLELFDTGGRLVRTLYEAQTSGRAVVRVSLEGMPSGVYIYRIGTPETELSNKMLLIR